MDKVIDFISIKQQKQNEQLEKLFRKGNSLQDVGNLNNLINEKQLIVQDHQLFLAFLKYLEDQRLDAKEVFHQVLKLPKHKFEHIYQMNWFSVVQLCFTFLTILKDNDNERYEEFLGLKNKD